MVIVPFPFSDLTTSRRRPALVVATLPGGDLLLRQITSGSFEDPDAIAVTADDFLAGGLSRSCHVRPGKLFAADSTLVISTAGSLLPDKVSEVTGKIAEIVSREQQPLDVSGEE